MTHETLFVVAALLGILAYFRPASSGPATGVSPLLASSGGAGSTLARSQVEQLARDAAARWPGVDWRMLVAMAWIESSFRPAVIGDDGTSFGLMQVARPTASWLAAEMGADDHGRHLSDSDLLRPEVSMHLAARYVQWLSRYAGTARSEEWIVRAYNGGPAWDSPTRANRALVLSNTLNHWTRYLRAKRDMGL